MDSHIAKPTVPWVPEVFLACGGNFRCWLQADTSSAVDRRLAEDLTETRIHARKVSGTGTQGYPGCQRLFMRGFRFRSTSSLVSVRPSADKTKLPVAREKKPLVPRVTQSKPTIEMFQIFNIKLIELGGGLFIPNPRV